MVAFFFDFFADHLVCYPHALALNVSGILTIKKDIARTRAFGRLSTDEQKRRLKTGRMSDLPPNSKDFILIRNKAACRGLPKAFQDQHITEGVRRIYLSQRCTQSGTGVMRMLRDECGESGIGLRLAAADLVSR